MTTDEQEFNDYLNRKKKNNILKESDDEVYDDEVYDDEVYDDYDDEEYNEPDRRHIKNNNPIERKNKPKPNVKSGMEAVEELRNLIYDKIDNIFYNFGMNGLQIVLQKIETINPTYDKVNETYRPRASHPASQKRQNNYSQQQYYVNDNSQKELERERLMFFLSESAPQTQTPLVGGKADYANVSSFIQSDDSKTIPNISDIEDVVTINEQTDMIEENDDVQA